jgi:hypothetical protein
MHFLLLLDLRNILLPYSRTATDDPEAARPDAKNSGSWGSSREAKSSRRSCPAGE